MRRRRPARIALAIAIVALLVVAGAAAAIWWRQLGSPRVALPITRAAPAQGDAASPRLTILDLEGRTMEVVGRDHLADGAHVVVVDPTDHHAYLPVPDGGNGRPVLVDEAPR